MYNNNNYKNNINISTIILFARVSGIINTFTNIGILTVIFS